MTKSPSRLWSLAVDYQSLVFLSIIAMVAELAYAVVNQSAIPPYLDVIGLKAQAGIVIGTFLVVETVFKSPMGSLGDRIGRRPLLVGGALISCATALGITVVDNVWGLMALRAADGVAAAAIWPTLAAAMSGSVPAHRRTLGMNALTVSYMAGLALGPLLGGATNDIMGSKLASFYLVSGLFLLTAMVALFLSPHRSKEEEAARSEGVEFRFSDVLAGLRTVPDMMFLAFVAFFAIGLLIPVVKYFAMDEFRMTETGFGLLVLPVAGAVALVSIFSGGIGDRWGKARPVRLGLALAATGMWTVMAAEVTWELLVAGALLGVGFMLAMPSWLALLADMSAPRMRGTALGSLGTAQGMGAVMGTVLGSHLYEGVSFGIAGLNSHYSPFILSAVSLTVCFGLVLVFIRDGDSRRIGGA